MVCENAVVFRQFVLGLFIRVNWGTNTERVSATCYIYFNVKRGAQTTRPQKYMKHYFDNKKKGDYDECVRGPPGANIVDGPWGVMAQGTKALALVANISGGRGDGWVQFVGPQRLLGKVGRNLGVWQGRCLWPDGDYGSFNVCWRYSVRDYIGWDWPRRRRGICGIRKRLLDWDWRLLEIFGLIPTSIRDIWSGPMLVWDIWVGIDVSWGFRCPDQSLGREHALWLHRELVRRCIDVAIGINGNYRVTTLIFNKYGDLFLGTPCTLTTG